MRAGVLGLLVALSFAVPKADAQALQRPVADVLPVAKPGWHWNDVVEVEVTWTPRCGGVNADDEYEPVITVSCPRAMPSPRRCRLDARDGGAVVAVLRKATGPRASQARTEDHFKLSFRLRDGSIATAYVPEQAVMGHAVRFNQDNRPRSLARADWVRLRDIVSSAPCAGVGEAG